MYRVPPFPLPSNKKSKLHLSRDVTVDASLTDAFSCSRLKRVFIGRNDSPHCVREEFNGRLTASVTFCGTVPHRSHCSASLKRPKRSQISQFSRLENLLYLERHF